MEDSQCCSPAIHSAKYSDKQDNVSDTDYDLEEVHIRGATDPVNEQVDGIEDDQMLLENRLIVILNKCYDNTVIKGIFKEFFVLTT